MNLQLTDRVCEQFCWNWNHFTGTDNIETYYLLQVHPLNICFFSNVAGIAIFSFHHFSYLYCRCTFQMIVHIKRVTSRKLRDDKQLRTHPCFITIIGTHNHTDRPESLKELRVLPGVQEDFEEYFKRGNMCIVISAEPLFTAPAVRLATARHCCRNVSTNQRRPVGEKECGEEGRVWRHTPARHCCCCWREIASARQHLVKLDTKSGARVNLNCLNVWITSLNVILLSFHCIKALSSTIIWQNIIVCVAPDVYRRSSAAGNSCVHMG